jgi:hypothetical protein
MPNAPTPPDGLDTTEERAAWLASLSDTDRATFIRSASAGKDALKWSEAQSHMKKQDAPADSKKSSAVPVMPDSAKTPEQQNAWLASLEPDELNKFIKARDDDDEGKGALGGMFNHTIFSGFNNPQSQDPILTSAKNIKAQRSEAKKNNQPDPTQQVAAGTDGDLAQGTAGVQSATDLMTDPVNYAFNAAHLDKDFRVPAGADTAYNGSSLQTTIGAKDKLNKLYDLNPDELTALQKKLQTAGLLSRYTPGVVTSDTTQAYLNLMVEAARHNTMGEELSPEQLLDQLAAKGGDGGQSQVHKQINLTDPLVAKALINHTLEGFLGRAPDPGEVLDFTHALANAQSSNPSTTTTQTGADGSTTSTTEGGLDESAFATDYVQKNYGSQIGTFNAATSLYDAALSVLGAGGR